MTKEDFITELQKLNIRLSPKQEQQLETFYELLITYNMKMNLTTITKKEDVYLKHFYDSLTLIKAVDLTKDLSVLDVGTGAGFPGIVLKIVFPNLKMTLLDSQLKRINYLGEVIKKLQLTAIETKCIRVEEYAKLNREKYDLVVARAVAHLGILVETTLPLLKIKGNLVAMKGNITTEISETSPILSKLNSQLKQIITFNLPFENSLRNLVVIEKQAKTDLKYPRRYDKIKKAYLK